MNHSSRFFISRPGEFLLAAVLVIFTTVAIRLAEWPAWDQSPFYVDGQHLMATHDAYVWLAGIKGIGNYVADPFTRLLAMVHEFTNVPVDELGFWSPVIFIPLLAIPICVTAAAMGMAESAVVFGILASSGLGFLVRTRLGFCDTDVLTLLFPVSAVCAFVYWLHLVRCSTWDEPPRPGRLMGFAFVVGVCGRLAIFVYPGSSSLLLPTFGVAVLLAAWRFRFEAALPVWQGLLLILGLSFGGWIGAGLVCAWSLLLLTGRIFLPFRTHAVVMTVLLAACLGFGDMREIIAALIYRLELYAKSGTSDLVNNATGLRLPDIAQSIREAQNLEWGQLGLRMGGNWYIFVLGMAGFVFACVRRVELVLFLPFLLFGLASVKLGNRFAMYGTVGIGVGLGFGLSELLILLGQSPARRWIAQLAMACFVLWPSATFMQSVSPVPVLPQTYAQTFLDLREIAEPNALLWQWWDYGYAGQYYAERATMGDGSRHDGAIVFPLGAVHMASSSTLARNMIQYFGSNVLTSGETNTTDARAALLLGDPLADFRKLKPSEGKSYLASLQSSGMSWPAAPPQYFIVSWENLRLAGWIGYYGNWDIVAGTSSAGKIQQLQGQIQVDSVAGAVLVNGANISVDSLDVVEAAGPRHFEWAKGAGMHVLVNQLARQVFLMDSKMYRSMMVQMLIAPPQTFAEDFTLVVDRYPWARAYKVKP